MKLSQNLSRLGTEAAFKVLADAKKKKLLSLLTFLTLKKSYLVATVTIIFRPIVLLSRYSQNLSKAADSR